MSANESSGSSPRQSAAWVDTDGSSGDGRIGDARLVKGGARVEFADDSRATEQPEPQGRSISEEEIAESGLLGERVIEIGETREEAIVSKHAVVREELVVRKTAEEHVEQVRDTVRRTEVDVDEGKGDRSAFKSFGSGESRTESSGTDKADSEGDRSR